MKFTITAIVAAAALALTSGCATTESVEKLQAQVNELKASTAKAQQTADAAAASAKAANAAADRAQASASEAQASADKSFGAAADATQTAKAAEGEVVKVDAKLDEMFKKLHRK